MLRYLFHFLRVRQAIITAMLASLLISYPQVLAADKGQVTGGGGLAGALFDTQYGQIKVLIPADARAGDTVSGSIFLQAKGDSQGEKTRNENELNSYAVDLAGRMTPVRLPEFSITLSDSVTALPISLKNRKGTTTATVELKSKPKPETTDLPTQFVAPTLGQAGWPIRCRGPFDGDFSNTSAALGGTSVLKMAESPRSLVLQCPNQAVGSKSLEVTEKDQLISWPLNIMSVKLSAPALEIPRGESVDLIITAQGMQGLKQPCTIVLDNRTPSIVRLEGGDQQSIVVDQQASALQATRKLTGIANGFFQVCAWVTGAPDDAMRAMSGTAAPTSARGEDQSNQAQHNQFRTNAPSAGASSDSSQTVTVLGTWSSNLGPVTIERYGTSPTAGVVSIIGSWQQGSQFGVIQRGTFDAATGILEFEYYQPLSNTSGTAKFSLSSDGRCLKGRFTQPGQTAAWTLTR